MFRFASGFGANIHNFARRRHQASRMSKMFGLLGSGLKRANFSSDNIDQAFKDTILLESTLECHF
ncbi:hypothetical protein HETIRDRAFT_409640 [Heterobasidion irregulare TC 32-1]|uniref:Uncharacterized protein n=1 Tax=Heterobasidion irregulare (strain TC 32-1) TaxID=747525 RepID=W4K850_HETIT|nr:uncharacterized protein HETIRDRAFT_434282 [Heterobasidion irregulare TC 32-1]XP_009546514.1 uncharacterized protein HETIRDRAFT_409640 [Heterobasidion irregulare TC 32-1]ETW81885.1 hypothetical protein HETIRDRAFT_434282 [Heterobasidion irregulare TC 32-1]ETW81924.1 hypothetical protein HETIRDRAFT_409640 [Heterobasidion irregulare TC 32-1]